MPHRIFSWVLAASMALSLAAGSPAADSLQTTGKASFYAEKFHGRATSSGETYNATDFTAAHKTLPFGTIVSVTNKKNGKNVIVRINDRGPFVRSRIIDLTRSAARKLEMIPHGVVPVRIQVLDVLDQCPIEDSLLEKDEVRDCFGNTKTLSDPAVYIWTTRDIRHAFYMATSLCLEYKQDSVYVAASETSKGRRYKLYISGLPSKKEAIALAATFREDGFIHSSLRTEPVSPIVPQPPGQSAK